MINTVEKVWKDLNISGVADIIGDMESDVLKVIKEFTRSLSGEPFCLS